MDLPCRVQRIARSASRLGGAADDQLPCT